MSDEMNFFVRIKDEEEKRKIYSSLCESRKDCVAKALAPNSELFSILPEALLNDTLRCRISNPPQQLKPDGSLIIQFFVGAEKYLSQMNYEKKLESLYFKINSELFHVQRREDFRLRLPMGFKATLEVQSINGKTLKGTLSLIDVSGGGCRLSLANKNIDLKSEDQITGLLQLSGRPPISIEGVVKHVAQNPEDGKTKIAGVQFKNLTALAKNRIVAVVMDLYRELFSRLKN